MVFVGAGVAGCCGVTVSHPAQRWKMFNRNSNRIDIKNIKTRASPDIHIARVSRVWISTAKGEWRGTEPSSFVSSVFSQPQVTCLFPHHHHNQSQRVENVTMYGHLLRTSTINIQLEPGPVCVYRVLRTRPSIRRDRSPNNPYPNEQSSLALSCSSKPLIDTVILWASFVRRRREYHSRRATRDGS